MGTFTFSDCLLLLRRNQKGKGFIKVEFSRLKTRKVPTYLLTYMCI